jgi:hypothetical protein
MKKFYRVCNPETQQGLWYDQSGNFTGLIHNEFNFCENSKLEMDFDEELVGWLSAVPTLDDLYKWFTVEDIIKLQEQGWFIHEYEAESFWFYEKFQHMVICQKTSKIISKCVITQTDDTTYYDIYIEQYLPLDNIKVELTLTT